MDQFNQTNNLQQAIDEVASNKDENVNQFGVPPMPPTEGEGTPAPFGEAAMPAATDATEGSSAEQILSSGLNAGATATVETPATATEAPAAPAMAPAEAPAMSSAPTPETPTVETSATTSEVSAEAPVDGDLASIREDVVKELIPLIDKVDSTPEEKFEIYKDAMKTMHDAKTIGGAYRTATQITDENKKADALMGLMRTIDNA